MYAELSSLIRSTNAKFSGVGRTEGCSPLAVFPYKFEALTRANSFFKKTITTCNQRYKDVVLSSKCNLRSTALRNNNLKVLSKRKDTFILSR